MQSKFGQKSSIFLIIIFIALLFDNVAFVSAESGTNKVPNLENTPLENLSFTTPSTDLSNWKLSVSLSESAENITKLKLETQICVYDPILCHAPETIDMIDDGEIWNGEITTLEKHAYVNWRIHIIYDNESEVLVPKRSEGYATVWSTCWEIMENQIIINNFDAEGCGADNSEEKNISGFPVITTLLSLALAASIIRRNQ